MGVSHTFKYSKPFFPLSHRTKMVEKFSRQESFYKIIKR